MNLIDTHCHLYASEFDADRADMIERAVKAGFEKLLIPNIDASSLEGLYQLADAYPGLCMPMMGLHPCSVRDNYKQELKTIEAELGKRPFIAIGEIGLDYYWDTTYKTEQQEAFRAQIHWAKELSLPIAIHTRNSFEDAIQIVRKETDGKLTGVFHCFSGNEADAERIMETGFMMGVGGVLTFKNSGLADALKNVPMEYLILETDAPYLAPVPFRGKRNESAYILNVAEKLAEVKGISFTAVADITTANAKRLFKLG